MKKVFVLMAMLLCACSAFAKVMVQADLPYGVGVNIVTNAFDDSDIVVESTGGAFSSLAALWEFDVEGNVKPYAGLSVGVLYYPAVMLEGGVDWTFAHREKLDWILRGGARVGITSEIINLEMNVPAMLEASVIFMNSKGKGFYGLAGLMGFMYFRPCIYQDFGLEYKLSLGMGVQLGVGYKF